MSLIAYLLVAAVSGLVVGAIARFILPGRDPMSILQTMLVGMAGSLAAGLVSLAIFDGRPRGGLLLSLVFATLFVWLIRRSRERSLHGHHGARRRGFSV